MTDKISMGEATEKENWMCFSGIKDVLLCQGLASLTALLQSEDSEVKTKTQRQKMRTTLYEYLPYS